MTDEMKKAVKSLAREITGGRDGYAMAYYTHHRYVSPLVVLSRTNGEEVCRWRYLPAAGWTVSAL